MTREEMLFEEFLTSRMRDKGVSLKRLADLTGIAPIHLENMVHGNFDNLPSSPYFHGYLVRVGKVLDFDGEEWWGKLRRDGVVKNAGPGDALPKNRFMKKDIPKSTWIFVGAAIIIVLYLAFELPRILGKPGLVITSPAQNPYMTASSTITLQGTVQNADALYISNGSASSSEEIPVNTDGSWQKTVLLQDGPNNFEISAKKFLGRETDFTQEVLYQSPVLPTTTIPTSTISS